MLNPISLTTPEFTYLGRTPQQYRTQEQTSPVGRMETLAPEVDPQLLGRMPAVAGKSEADGKRTDRKGLQKQECKTCKNRKYQDGSNDPGVSFKSPTKIDPGQSARVVRSHENEHVVREKRNAEREGREIISQTVVLRTSVCPECGRIYVSGGITRTVTRNAQEEEDQFAQGRHYHRHGKRALSVKV